AALRLRRRAADGAPSEQGILVPYVDVHIFADELASYGPEIRVVEPAALRAQVIARLERTLAAHTEPGSTP
ncbi:WYL domain-containing protein, partial [Microbacterium sp.]|uniref:WYL domain-containing protein n=1 Tax=Microbacterium sp. TaxID=51671 RepID=UPI003C72A87E